MFYSFESFKWGSPLLHHLLDPLIYSPRIDAISVKLWSCNKYSRVKSVFFPLVYTDVSVLSSQVTYLSPCCYFSLSNNLLVGFLSNSIQFNFIYIASITIQIVSRIFTETQIMTPDQISLTKVIIWNPNQRKMAGKKKTPPAGEKNTLSQTVARKKLH